MKLPHRILERLRKEKTTGETRRYRFAGASRNIELIDNGRLITNTVIMKASLSQLENML